MSVPPYSLGTMAESPPAILRALEAATGTHPLDRKVLLCRSIGEGRELLRALATSGRSWLGWEITTPRRLALDLAGPRLLARGLTLADDFDQEAGVDTALHDALADDPDSPLARLGEATGFRDAIAGAIRELDLAGVGPDRLRGTPASNVRLRDLLARVLEGQRAWLAGKDLVSVGDILRLAADEVGAGAHRSLEDSLLFMVPGLPSAGATGELVEALDALGARTLEADPVTIQPPPTIRWAAADESAPLGGLLGDRPTCDGADLDLFAASGPAEEVREVVRRIAAAGLAWDEAEIIATDPVVYGGALHALGQRLGIPVSFAVGLPVERTRTGRATAAYFRWLQEGYPAVEIRRLLESGDLRPADYDGSTTRLARALRRLRVGWGRGRFMPAVDRALERLAGPDPETGAASEAAAERDRRDREDLQALRAVLAPLVAATPEVDLTDPAARVSPAEIAHGLRRFLELVPAGDRPSATARDRFLAIADRITARLTRPMHPAAALAAVRRHLRIRVPAPDREGAAPWVSSGGYLHLSDVDHGGLTGRRVTFVVGLDAERFPGAGLQDPILLDAQRRALDPRALPGSAERLAAQRFALATTLARLRGTVTLSYSAWDPVQAREVAPSPVMLQAHRAAAGDPGASFEEMVNALGDAASAVPRGQPLDDADLWLGALSRDGILLDGTEAVRQAFPDLAAGQDALDLLDGEDATARHGLIDPRPGLDFRHAPDAVLSASGLEDLGTCGLRFFFKYALRIRPPDDPELDPDRWLDALQRGSLLHAVYERALREGRDAGLRAADPAFLDLALDALEQEAAAMRREVPPPGAAVFEREMLLLREDVRSFAGMVADSDDRWESLELRFGLGDEPPAEVPLRRGVLRLRGAIDRVDRTPEGDLVVVDYKTGGTTRFERDRGLFNGGRRLQSVVYAAVAEAILGARVARMEYHFPTRGGRNETLGFSRAETRRGLGLLDRLLDMAAAGRFLPTPQGDDCRFCDFQAVCRHRFEGFTSHTPMADWAARRVEALDEFAELRDVRGWEDLLLGDMDADG